MTTISNVPRPDLIRNGVRHWSWFNSEEREFSIKAADSAALLDADDVWLSAAQCREAAAVLLALADEAEQS